MATAVLPPPLQPGDTVAVIAPASPFEPVLTWVGLGWLARRYRVLFDPDRTSAPADGADRGLFARSGFLAVSDSRRREELVRALEHPDVRAIFTARGGYGANRFV